MPGEGERRAIDLMLVKQRLGRRQDGARLCNGDELRGAGHHMGAAEQRLGLNIVGVERQRALPKRGGNAETLGIGHEERPRGGLLAAA